MNSNTTAFVERCVSEINDAIEQFGSYSYGDKGPQEVMDLGPLLAELKKMPAQDAAQALRSVAHSKAKGDPRSLTESLLIDLQDWDALFEQPGVDEMINGQSPALLPGDEPLKKAGRRPKL